MKTCKRKWTVLALAIALAFSAVLACSAGWAASARSAQNGKKTLGGTKRAVSKRTIPASAVDKVFNNPTKTKFAVPKKAIPSVIQARRIEIVDRSGKTCMRLSGDPWPRVELLDTAGKEAVSIDAPSGLFANVSVGDSRSRLLLMSNGLTLWSNEVQCATLELGRDGKPSLTLWYPNGKSAATMELTGDGLPRILAWNKDGTACNPGMFGATSSPSLSAPPLLSLPPSVSSVPTLPGRKASEIYLSNGSGHWISSVSDDGRLVTLEDDSIWEITPLDQINTQLWLATSDIVVVDSTNPSYPYRLINKDDNETAEAKLLSD